MRTRPGYARVLVEVDVSKTLVKEVSFRLPNGREICQEVFFEHPPSLCDECKRIGHTTASCKMAEPQGRRRSVSRGRKNGKMAENSGHVRGRKTGFTAANNLRQTQGFADGKIQGDTQNVKVMKTGIPAVNNLQHTHGSADGKIMGGTQNVEGRKEGEKGGENVLLMEKNPGKNDGLLSEACATGDRLKKKMVQPCEEVCIDETGGGFQGDQENGGKLVVDFKGYEAAGKTAYEASSSNTNVIATKNKEEMVVGIFKLPIREETKNNSDEEDNRNVAKMVMAEKRATSRSNNLMFLDIATEEELAEMEKNRGLETVVAKKDKKKEKGKWKEKSRSRHK